MKLYTEEQVKNAIEIATTDDIDSYSQVLERLTPIKLPTAVEVEAKSEDVFREYPNNPKECPEWKYNKDINAPRKRKAFIMGSNWVINQIKKQSDEHNTNKG